MARRREGFDLRRDHGFRNPPVPPPVPFLGVEHPTSHASFTQQSDDHPSRPLGTAAHSDIEASGCEGVEEADGLGENGEGGRALNLAAHQEGVIWQRGEEEGAEKTGEDCDEELDWAMSPEWAEHFRNSPSVQRYLQRMEAKQGSKWKDTRGGRGRTEQSGSGSNNIKNSSSNSNNKGNSSKKGNNNNKGNNNGGSKGSAKGKRPQQAAAKKGGKSPGGSTSGSAERGHQVSEPAGAPRQEDMELQLAKIKAQALLYAEGQHSRPLEDAVPST